MEKVAYEVGGNTVGTLKELASLLGVGKVTAKELEQGKYSDSVSIIDLEDENAKSDEEWEGEKLKVYKKPEKHPMESDLDPDKVYTALTGDEPEITKKEVLDSFPKFEDLEELKEFIKEMDTPTLEYLARGMELDWLPTYHANIHRMRIAMAMHRYFFPELFEPKESKKKTKYADMTTEHLMEVLEEHGLNLEKTDNEAINRMKAIMLLKKEGHIEEE